MVSRLGKGFVADLAFGVVLVVASAFIQDFNLAFLVTMGVIIVAYLLWRFVIRKDPGASQKE